MKFYEGCTALITGASSGLGAEFAWQLAPCAKHLILVARRLDRLEALKGELESIHSGLTVHVYGANLGAEHEREVLAQWVLAQNLNVDLLINNAGLGDRGVFVEGTWEKARAMIDVNISALTHLSYALLPSMTRTGHGAILNVSSVASFFPLPKMAVYSATKAYVTALSEALALELRPLGITVTALCPGPIKTEFFEVAKRSDGDDQLAHYDSMPGFVVTPAQAVRTGLDAVVRRRARIVPGLALSVAVGAALLVPFFITREILRAFSTKL